jgi:hypothetical protein
MGLTPLGVDAGDVRAVRGVGLRDRARLSRLPRAMQRRRDAARAAHALEGTRVRAGRALQPRRVRRRLVAQSMLALWLYQRHGVDPGEAGAIFFATSILAAISFLVAVRIAERIGL